MWILLAIAAGTILVPYYLNTARLMKKHDHRIGLFMMGALLFTLPFVVVMLPKADTAMEWLVIGAGCIYGISGIPFQISYRYVSPLIIAVSGEMVPVIAALLGWIVLRERMSFGEVVAFVAILAGSAFAAMSSGNKKTAAKGYFIILCACMFTATYQVLTKHGKNAAGFNGLELLMMHRTGVFLSNMMLLITPLRRDMLEFFKLSNADKLGIALNNLMFISFAVMFATAMATQPQARNNGLIGAVYFGIVQTGLFLHGALTGHESHITRKALGASIAFAGLIWLAMQ